MSAFMHVCVNQCFQSMFYSVSTRSKVILDDSV